MGGGGLMSTGISSSTVGVGSGGPPGILGNPNNGNGGNGGSGIGGVGPPGSMMPSAPGSTIVDPRAVSVVVTLPGPQHGQALSDYGPI
ncbi:unnamed protein product [Hermetia illucens]|uniref:Uncharacterized protein n=1 Tax=Hermetia illucens TaxID=343691 RepID=A0A7R8YQ48_HERIL|nr:unnamed protein product [Hermetia illucens]